MGTDVRYLMFLVGVITASRCPKWETVGGGYYCLVNDTMAWYDGLAICSGMNGSMAVPDSYEEQQLIWQMFKENYEEGNLWIGCRNDLSEGNFVQPGSGGGECVYTDWAPGEPKDTYGYDCVQLWDQFGGRWDDTLCTDNRAVICEYPAPAVPATEVKLTCIQADANGRFTAP